MWEEGGHWPHPYKKAIQLSLLRNVLTLSPSHGSRLLTLTTAGGRWSCTLRWRKEVGGDLGVLVLLHSAPALEDATLSPSRQRVVGY